MALTSPGSEITGKALPAPEVSAILSLDGTTGAVRHRLDGFNPAAHLLAVDSRTRRAFVTTGYTVVVLDLTRF